MENEKVVKVTGASSQTMIDRMRVMHGSKAILLIKEDEVRAYTTNCYGSKSLGSWLAEGFKLEGQYKRDIAKRKRRLSSLQFPRT